MVRGFCWVKVFASGRQSCREYALLGKFVYSIHGFFNIQNVIYSDEWMEDKSEKRFITRLWLGIVEMYHVTQFYQFISCYQISFTWKLYYRQTNFLVVRLIMVRQIYIMTNMHVYSLNGSIFLWLLFFFHCFQIWDGVVLIS